MGDIIPGHCCGGEGTDEEVLDILHQGRALGVCVAGGGVSHPPWPTDPNPSSPARPLRLGLPQPPLPRRNSRTSCIKTLAKFLKEQFLTCGVFCRYISLGRGGGTSYLAAMLEVF